MNMMQVLVVLVEVGRVSTGAIARRTRDVRVAADRGGTHELVQIELDRVRKAIGRTLRVGGVVAVGGGLTVATDRRSSRARYARHGQTDGGCR